MGSSFIQVLPVVFGFVVPSCVVHFLVPPYKMTSRITLSQKKLLPQNLPEDQVDELLERPGTPRRFGSDHRSLPAVI